MERQLKSKPYRHRLPFIIFIVFIGFSFIAAIYTAMLYNPNANIGKLTAFLQLPYSDIAVNILIILALATTAFTCIAVLFFIIRYTFSKIYHPQLADKAHLNKAQPFIVENAAGKIKSLSEEIQMNPANDSCWHMRGTTLHEIKRYEEALSDLTKATQLSPNNALYWHSRSVTLNELKQHKAALDDLAKAITLEPHNADYHYSRSIILHNMKQYEAALSEITKAADLAPDNALFWYIRSSTLREMKHYEKALAEITKAIQLEPNNAVFRFSRSIILNEMQQREKALADITKATELEPNNAFYWDSRGVTLHEMKRYEEALSASTKATALAPDIAPYWDSRCTTLHSMKRYKDALANSSQALTLDPANPEYLASQMVCQYSLGNYGAALTGFNIAIKRDAAMSFAYRYRGLTALMLALQNNRQPDTASILADMDAAVSLDEDNAHNFIGRAKCYYLWGLFDDAEKDLITAENIDIAEPETYHLQALIQEKMGNTEEAVRLHKKAKELGYIEESGNNNKFSMPVKVLPN